MARIDSPASVFGAFGPSAFFFFPDLLKSYWGIYYASDCGDKGQRSRKVCEQFFNQMSIR